MIGVAKPRRPVATCPLAGDPLLGGRLVAQHLLEGAHAGREVIHVASHGIHPLSGYLQVLPGRQELRRETDDALFETQHTLVAGCEKHQGSCQQPQQ